MVVLMMIRYQSFAVDKSIHFGKWNGKLDGDLVSLRASKKKIIIYMKGNKINQPINYEYSYS